MLDLLRGGDSARLFVSSLVGRAPATALSLVLVLRTKELTGSFAAAGLASGSNALANAVCSPVLGRWLDRRGQPPILLVGAVVSALAMAAFAALPHGVSLAAILPCAVVAGAAMPPLGACLRTLWPLLLESPERLHAAFALDAAAIEVVYIAGPVLIAGALGAWSLSASAVACAVLLVLGTVVFATSPSSRGWRPGVREESGGALRAPGVRTLAVVFVLIGLAFGAIEVAVPAAADHAGSQGAASLLLGGWGLGSLVGGLFATRSAAPRDPVGRLCVYLTLLTCGHLLLALPSGLLVLGALLFLSGAVIAPSFGLAYGLVEGAAAAGTVTEAYTWLSTGLAGGIAAGAALAGVLAEGAGPSGGFLLAAFGAACAALTVGAARAALVPTPR
ncbi:MFS transporter [Solirubrobacter ginsenosidimutans]|uniref:MFS transporter n=1 Tax=Solirubrobacter ginsenosidimutans TaxID=490573 RepID=A0A9X3S5D0_9ACTN|nr:MFS transporter [Solirubrobacter ginsenosidimutans]MDA0161488.1 MFS transporter [Solirubrobacter ginsenosidimutans]